MGRGRSLVTISRRCCLRRNTSSAKQIEGQRSDHPSRTGTGSCAWKDKH